MSRSFDVPWVRAPNLRHSVGTCHRRFAIARWARLRFALLWVYWVLLFLCVGPVGGLSDVGLSDVELSEVGLSDFFGNWFSQCQGKY